MYAHQTFNSRQTKIAQGEIDGVFLINSCLVQLMKVILRCCSKN